MTDKKSKPRRYRVEGDLLLAEGVVLKHGKTGGPPKLHQPKPKRLK